MNDTPDHELLRCYAEHGAEEAFAELVKRHIDLVWAAAWRVSGDRELARDVAQTVFTDLARKAKKLPGGTVLPGWLYRAACYAAAMHIRGEARRAQRERQAMQEKHLQQADAAEAQAAAELQPVLDAALADLTETDRDAVVLRFLAGRSLAEVGATLGTNDDAAQKRVSRALEKLREAFRKRGVAVSGGIVAAALGVAGAQAAPVGLGGAIATAALAGVGTAAWGTFSMVTFMKSKLALGIVGGVVVATTLAWQQRSITRLADENAGLRRQATPPPAPAAAPADADIAELTRLRGEHAELLRLRGEVSRLRQSGPSGANDLSRRLQSAEARASQAEAEAALVVAMQKSEAYTGAVINAGKNLGLAARIFATDHKDRLPTTFDEMRNEMNLRPDGTFSGGISPDQFEFFPHERVISEQEPEMILFREKAARQLPNGTWQRIYCLADGSVQTRHSADGDFSQIDREGTGTAANAPRKR
jgi:RNA polymerase sigma factor (sigma-70 family)